MKRGFKTRQSEEETVSHCWRLKMPLWKKPLLVHKLPQKHTGTINFPLLCPPISVPLIIRRWYIRVRFQSMYRFLCNKMGSTSECCRVIPKHSCFVYLLSHLKKSPRNSFRELPTEWFHGEHRFHRKREAEKKVKDYPSVLKAHCNVPTVLSCLEGTMINRWKLREITKKNSPHVASERSIDGAFWFIDWKDFCCSLKSLHRL